MVKGESLAFAVQGDVSKHKDAVARLGAGQRSDHTQLVGVLKRYPISGFKLDTGMRAAGDNRSVLVGDFGRHAADRSDLSAREVHQRLEEVELVAGILAGPEVDEHATLGRKHGLMARI